MRFLLLSVVVLAGAAGDVCVARAMKAAAGAEGPWATAACAVRNLFLWLGIGWKAIAFFSLLGLLTLADLSWVVPATAVSFVLEVLAAKIFLRERVSSTRWAGALCVCLGVALISL
ncbi:MAG: hypothetical protein HY647_12805 [Acidobacteria bacterium]|nr:hypothetical protein [Acidobacteriota bacterium]